MICKTSQNIAIMLSETDIGKKRWHTVIVGAGQAGLAAGYFLKKANQEFIILDKNAKVGDSWRKRWDSLKLFTPTRHDGLPGAPFPGSRNSFPGKDEMADYLENYVLKFSLPVQSGIEVNQLIRRNDHFEIRYPSGKVLADRIVIATGTNPCPSVPGFAADLNPDIFQIHSSAYINPGSIPDGEVLVVGAGNSGVEIALEVSKTRKTFISGKPTFHIPDNIFKYAGEPYWWFISNILTVRTPIGRKARKSILHGGTPLIRISADDLDQAGVKRLPRVTGIKDGLPQLADGKIIRVASVIWATGYKPDFSWIDLSIRDETGWPSTNRGVSTSHKGLYFIGMPFQYGLTSGLVGGVGRDAAYISRHIIKS
jgi:putative flavoprotein involved in K+ transport